MNPIIDTLKAEGLQVWMRSPESEYCYVTDGTNIAYVQWSDRTCISSVHIPNQSTGTGFQIFDSITPDNVRKAMVTVAPAWATTSDRQSVKKYKDWNSFHKSDSFHAQLFQA